MAPASRRLLPDRHDFGDTANENEVTSMIATNPIRSGLHPELQRGEAQIQEVGAGQ
jgi:hypothetical protein